jgi:predicted MFS family arabinose efflux permease
MVLALSAQAACVVATGALAASGTLTVPLALLLVLLFGISDGLYVVPSQVAVGRIVPPHAMAAAIGTSMLSIGLGRILGGPVGGALVAGLGPAGAMLPGGVGVILAALTIRTLPRVEGTGGGARLRRRDLSDGIDLLRHTAGAWSMLIMGAIAALFLWPYTGMLAVVVRELLEGTPEDLGLLTAAGGVGAILAAVSMGAVGRRIGRGRQLVAVMAIAGGSLVLLGVSHALLLTLVASTVAATMTVTHNATSTLLVQAIVPVAMRGRALALYGFVFFGGLPLGFLGAGLAADAFGVGPVLVALGIGTAAGALLLAAADRQLLRLDVGALPADAGRPPDAHEPVPALADPR